MPPPGRDSMAASACAAIVFLMRARHGCACVQHGCVCLVRGRPGRKRSRMPLRALGDKARHACACSARSQYALLAVRGRSTHSMLEWLGRASAPRRPRSRPLFRPVDSGSCCHCESFALLRRLNLKRSSGARAREIVPTAPPIWRALSALLLQVVLRSSYHPRSPPSPPPDLQRSRSHASSTSHPPPARVRVWPPELSQKSKRVRVNLQPSHFAGVAAPSLGSRCPLSLVPRVPRRATAGKACIVVLVCRVRFGRACAHGANHSRVRLQVLKRP